MAKTVITFIGGLNKDRIGANCQVLEHTDSSGKTTRVMVDLGSLFVPYGSEFSLAYPNVDKYFDRIDIEKQQATKALKPIEALFITHAHQDHIGALIACVQMGYQLPPIYTDEYTGHNIRLAFHAEGVKTPELKRVKDSDEVMIGDVEVTPFNVSHSSVNALGFMIRTFDNGKPYTRVIDYGDFLTLEKMPIGHAFNKESHLKMLKEKPAPTTLVELDSTSTGRSTVERIGFEQAVENTYAVCKENKDRHIVISPVIASSLNNIAIDLEVARRLNTKIMLDGQGLKIPLNALKLSGIDTYEDQIYHGHMRAYLADNSVKTKYIVNTGALGQGLLEYENNLSDTPTSPIYTSSLTKMALGLHPDIKISKDCLALMRQRDIVSITGTSGAQIRQLLASQGAKVVMTPGTKPQKHFQEVIMQDPNHIDAQSLVDLMKDVREVSDKLIAFPLHGTVEQRQTTKELMESVEIDSFMSENGESFELNPNGVHSMEENQINTWLALRNVLPGMDERADVPLEGISQFWLINENYERIKQLGEVDNVRRSGAKPHKSSKIDEDEIERLGQLPMREKIFHSKKNGHKEY